MTEISVDDKTKAELLKIAAQLQIIRKEKINYNTAIKYLIDQYQSKKKNKEKFRNACQKVEHIDIDDVFKELYAERQKN